MHFPAVVFREMPLVAHTENISLFFCGLALLTWSSLAMDVRFRGVPPGSRSPTVFLLTAESKTTKRSRGERRTTLNMKPQTAVLFNREATKHNVDKWMEDLFARIQLCVMHPHSVIQRDGTTNEEETMFEELRTREVPVGAQDHQLRSTNCRR